jgi:cytochrome c oxidase subunit III
MASSAPAIALDEPRTTLGDDGVPPPARDAGDDGSGDGSPDFATRLRRARLGMSVAIAGIVMIFVSFTSAYFVRQGLPTLDPRTDALVRDWIPVRLPSLLLFNTCVLLVSSLTMALARRQVAREAALAGGASTPGTSAGHESRFSWLTLTVFLGLGFLSMQWLAWRELAASGFYVATSPSSSFVYLLTGMHGVHLLGGVLALLAAGAASLLHRPVRSRLIILDVTGWYWHFMALLWIYIFCLLEFAG